jgi:diketogulonate reductase-like aldo/keto reductase
VRQRRLLGTDMVLPVIGQGTWKMEGDDRTLAISALQAGVDAGMTHVDTAELYGHGVVEELVGEALSRRRDQVFLVSKVLPQNASYEGTLKACEQSLRRLRTDRLDLYLLHWRGRFPLEETFRAFDALQQSGKLRRWGVSNFDLDDIDEAVKLVGEGKIACNQVLYHLQERAIEHRLIPLCERHDITVVAYSPFGAGRFPHASASRHPGAKILDEVALAHRASVHQVALAFLVRRPSVLAIPKAARVEHARDNAAGGDLELSEDEIARIDAVFPLGKDDGRLPVI